MRRFFRCQTKGYSFEEMQRYSSKSGADNEGEGLCVSDSVHPRCFGGAWDAMNDDDEVIVLEGEVLCEIYDGYRIRPTREIARFTCREWAQMVRDGRANEYEAW